MLFQDLTGHGFGIDSVRYQGTLRYWYEDRGYGFISPDDGSQDVFIYFSQLEHLCRPPQLGDRITYELDELSGRPKAVKADIPGVPRRSYGFSKMGMAQLFSARNILRFWMLILVSIILFMTLERWQSLQDDKEALAASPYPDMLRSSLSVFPFDPARQCGIKNQCSQMRSCQEAIYYLDECGVTGLDPDNNRIPCEQSVCSLAQEK